MRISFEPALPRVEQRQVWRSLGLRHSDALLVDRNGSRYESFSVETVHTGQTLALAKQVTARKGGVRSLRRGQFCVRPKPRASNNRDARHHQAAERGTLLAADLDRGRFPFKRGVYFHRFHTR
eukprot:3196479-Prymnesium_polylepis.1